MKHAFVSIKALLCAILLFVSWQLEGQARHPGPRATCPICAANLIRSLNHPEVVAKMSTREKISFVKQKYPKVSPTQVVQILDNYERVNLRKIAIEHDESFQ